jgi:tetratricopeptide (TPR) repeat protein
MRRLLVVLCLCACGAFPARAAAQLRAPGSNQPLHAFEVVEDGRIRRLEEWLKTLARHAPGEEDAALAEAATWPNAELKTLWLDANALVQLIRLPLDRRSGRFTVRSEGQKNAVLIRYSPIQFKRLVELACAAGGSLRELSCINMNATAELDPDLRQLGEIVRETRARGDDNYILRHGAILHSDVAMLAPAAMVAPGEVGRPSGSLERFRMAISDGQEIELRQSAIHWEIARMLLDLVVPRGGDKAAPGRDDMVRQWYRATAAWMQLREDHDKLHLDRARAIFPADPDILFLSACQHEAYAGVPIQTAVRSAILPTGVTLDVGSERVELREAEGLFRRVLEIKPDYAEARLRYGRVLGGLGKHAEAAAELRRAVAGLADRQMLYLAELFLGGEEEALGNRDSARLAYQQAADLSPMAQSPLVALSQLARRSGDRAGALREIGRLFAFQDDDRGPQDDPWWWYYVVQARNAEELLESMEQPYRAERLQ